MNLYSTIVHWSDEDGLFLVTMPEFADRVVMVIYFANQFDRPSNKRANSNFICRRIREFRGGVAGLFSSLRFKKLVARSPALIVKI
jgi:hypothetical protein